MTWLYRNPHGVVQPIQVAYGSCKVAVGYANKLVAADNLSDIYKFEDGAWARTVDNSVDNVFLNGYDDSVLSSLPSCLFVTTNGSLLLSFSPGNAIWRSIDDGVTWARVLNFYSGVNTTNRADTICQADNGWIYLPQYHQKSPTTKDVHVWRSKDDGVTWEDLAAKPVYNSAGASLGTITSQVAAHIHGVMWDKYRNHLYVSHGDSSTVDNVFVSDDYGETFYEISTIQTVAMVATETAVFLTGDDSADRKIYKLDLTGLTTALQVSGVTPTVSMDPTAAPFSKAVQADMGFAWGGYYDGVHIIFPFNSGNLAVSANGGATWLNLLDIGASNVIEQSRGIVSSYNTGWDGFFYWALETASIYQLRVYADTQTIDFSKSQAGYLDFLADPVTDGMGQLREYLPWDATVNFKVPERLYRAETNLVVQTYEDDFEGSVVLSTTGTATVTHGSTDDKYSGTKSGKIVATTGQSGAFQKTSLSYGVGQTITMECRIKTDINISTGSPYVMKMDGASIAVQLQIDTNQRPILSFNLPTEATRVYRENFEPTLDTAKTLVSGSWRHLRWETYLHATKGWTRLFIDGAIAIEAIGVATLESGNSITSIGFGVNPTQSLTVYYDECKAGEKITPRLSQTLLAVDSELKSKSLANRAITKMKWSQETTRIMS